MSAAGQLTSAPAYATVLLGQSTTRVVSLCFQSNCTLALTSQDFACTTSCCTTMRCCRCWPCIEHATKALCKPYLRFDLEEPAKDFLVGKAVKGASQPIHAC